MIFTNLYGIEGVRCAFNLLRREVYFDLGNVELPDVNARGSAAYIPKLTITKQLVRLMQTGHWKLGIPGRDNILHNRRDLELLMSCLAATRDLPFASPSWASVTEAVTCGCNQPQQNIPPPIFFICKTLPIFFEPLELCRTSFPSRFYAGILCTSVSSCRCPQHLANPFPCPTLFLHYPSQRENPQARIPFRSR